MMRSILAKKIPQLVVLLILIAVGLLGWIVGYPATSGYVRHEMDVPFGFDLQDAEQALVNDGYLVEADHAPGFDRDPYLRVTGPPRNDGFTIISLTLDEQNDSMEVFASRQIFIPPYMVVQDLHELGREHQRVSEEDIREVLGVVGLPSTGTFTFIDDIDSLDYFIPTTVFYILVFVHLPVVIVLVVFTAIYKERQHISYEETEPSPRIRV